MKRVLILGARAPVALDLARRFFAAGHRVFVADSLRFPGARPSRAVSKFFLLPRPRTAPSTFAARLYALCRDHRIDVLIPTCEEVFYVARFLDDFPPGVVFADRFEKLAGLHNKQSFYDQVRSFASAETGMVPETRSLGASLTPADLEPSENWVFKPTYSRFASETLVSPNEQALASIDYRKRPWIAQRRVFGTEYSTYGVAYRGRLLAHAAYRSEYRVDRGSGVLFRNVSQRKTTIQRFVERFVTETNYTGQLGFDCIESPGGQLYVLECNPRATSGLHLFPVDGRLAHAFLAPETIERPLVADGPDHMLAFAMAFIDEVQRRKLRAWPHIARDMWRTKDVIFSWRDPGPTLGLGLALSEILWIAGRTGRSLTSASTFDIEFDGQPL
ncbi:MAG: ATP-grasp domain-containing protein [Myxococcota bacterium]